MTTPETPVIPGRLTSLASWLATGVVFLSALTVLFKLRIVALLLFAGAGGSFLAAGGWPGIGPLIAMTLTGGLAAAGASALNQYLEQAEDASMRRTRQRPLVSGLISRPAWVPVIAISLIVIPSLIALPFNPALALWSFSGAVIYVGVYTVWLKPRTVLNIVVGGLAGMCAVLSGGAAVGPSTGAQGWAHPGVVVLGLLVFLWTPTHFWSLAIMCREDYARVNVPMLPARTSLRRSAFWVAVHGAATGFAALALGAEATLGWLYFIPAAAATFDLLRRCGQLLAEPTTARARVLFITSNTYLAIIVLAVCIAALI
ncbi:MAG: heme o synthase [Chloroflexota bacterium]